MIEDWANNLDFLAAILHAVEAQSQRRVKDVIRRFGGGGTTSGLDQVIRHIQSHPELDQIRQLADQIIEPDPYSKTLEDQVRDRIEQSGLSTVELANRLGVPQPAVSRFMTGARQTVNAKTLDRYIRELGGARLVWAKKKKAKNPHPPTPSHERA